MASSFTLHPNSVLDYVLDLTTWLGVDTISTATWAAPAGVTLGNGANGAPAPSATTLKATVWLVGVTAGNDYTVSCTIVTAGGRTDVFTETFTASTPADKGKRAVYSELTTVNEVRSRYLAATGTTDDLLILNAIRDVSRQMNAAAGGLRHFHPLIQTRYRDATLDVSGSALYLDDDLLSATTVTNGDAVAVSSSNYVTEPRNETPYYALTLKGSSGLVWTYSTDAENAISIAGVWGYHADYANAWADTGATVLDAGGLTGTTTALTTLTNYLFPGELIRFGASGTDWAYIKATAQAGVNDTHTLVRSVNGSTGTAVALNTAIYRWTIADDLAGLACRCAAALYRLRDNPLADTTTIDGVTFTHPKDVEKYIKQQIEDSQYHKLGFG